MNRLSMPWLSLILFAALPVRAEVVSFTAPAGQLDSVGADFVSSGWGQYVPDRSTPCFPDELREQHWEIIRANREALRLPPADRSMLVLFGWPLAAPGLDDFGYHGISNFVDQNAAFPNAILDYNCGARTYDQSSGYNHSGIDFFTWPWSWKKMADNAVHVVAAAPGVIVAKFDGNNDQSCGFANCNWNAVYVQHADGSTAWYGHMKRFSLTSKNVGESVAAQEYLGVVGSSGCSTGPHLHFEVYDSGGNLIEPYSGPCNSLNPTTWWASQRPYYDSAVNALTTGSAPPVFPSCPNQESPNEAIQFSSGSVIYFTAYYRDQRNANLSVYRILRPNGTTFSTWSHVPPDPHYAASFWWWSLPVSGPAGIWKFQVTFNSVVYEQPFAIGTVVGVEDLAVLPGRSGIFGSSPNPFNDATEVLFDLVRPSRATLDVYDLAGRNVRKLWGGELQSGRHSRVWDGRDERGTPLAAGVYFVRMKADGVEDTKKVTLER